MTKTRITSTCSASSVAIHKLLTRLYLYKEVIELPFAICATYYASVEEITSQLTPKQLKTIDLIAL